MKKNIGFVVMRNKTILNKVYYQSIGRTSNTSKHSQIVSQTIFIKILKRSGIDSNQKNHGNFFFFLAMRGVLDKDYQNFIPFSSFIRILITDR